MAATVFFTGFEGGESVGRFASPPPMGAVIGDGTARSGEFYCKHVSPSTGFNAEQRIALDPAFGTSGSFRLVYRVFLRILRYPDGLNCYVGGLGGENIFLSGNFCINSLGQYAVVIVTPSNISSFSSYSSTSLQLGVWNRMDFVYDFNRASVFGPFNINHRATVTLNPYDQFGNALESVSRIYAAERGTITVIIPTYCVLGNASGIPNAYEFDFDDLYIEARDGSDFTGVFNLPTQTRINRAGITGQGSLAEWTGDYRRVTHIPRPRTVAGDGSQEQSSNLVNTTTTFLHDTAENLQLGNIVAITMCACMKSNVGGTEAFFWNGFEFPVTIPTSYGQETTVVSVSTGWNHATFNAMEFGLRNKTGSLLNACKCYLEVLHDGAGLGPPFLDVAGGYQHKILKWTGNSGYQSITGVGFAAQAIMIKAIDPNHTGTDCIKIAKSGGTLAWRGLTDYVTDAVLGITEDGCNLGPNLACNSSGINYVGIFFKDGGSNNEGYLFDCGSYLGSPTLGTNLNIIMNHPFKPDMIMVNFNRWKIVFPPGNVFDSSIRLKGMNSANQLNGIIQSHSDGFSIGTDPDVNPNPTGDIDAINIYLAVKASVGKGTVVGAHDNTAIAPVTISGILFTPIYIIAQSDFAGSVPATLRHGIFRVNPYFTGANSKQWTSAATALTAVGITSITPTGFVYDSDAIINLPSRTIYIVFGDLKFSGIYFINPNKSNRHDSYYNSENKIPDPTVRTALIGE